MTFRVLTNVLNFITKKKRIKPSKRDEKIQKNDLKHFKDEYVPLLSITSLRYIVTAIASIELMFFIWEILFQLRGTNIWFV